MPKLLKPLDIIMDGRRLWQTTAFQKPDFSKDSQYDSEFSALGITKTCLFKYTENFTTKNDIFQKKKKCYSSYFCLKYRLWVPVRTVSSRRF